MSEIEVLWERIKGPYLDSNWQESIGQVRALVDADPFAMVPRQLLAWLHLKVSDQRMALLQYEKLLPLAVGRGDLFRALGIQKQIDSIHPAAQVSGRYVAMQRWFRLVGFSRAASIPTQGTGGLTPAGLLALPSELFERAADALTIDMLDPEPRTVEAEGGALWLVLYGQVRWWIEFADGSRSEERHSGEGQGIRVDPEASEARVVLRPTVPTECVHLNASLMRQLAGLIPALAQANASSARELSIGARSAPVVTDAGEAKRLGRAGAGSAQTAAAAHKAAAHETAVREAAEQPRPQAQPAASAAREEPVPRRQRREPRVALSLASRVSHLDADCEDVPPIRGEIVDLSRGGLGMYFKSEELWTVLSTFRGGAVGVELEAPGIKAMRLPARVRSLEFLDEEHTARMGLEFVLLTDADRATLEALIAAAPQSAEDRQAS